MIPANTPPLVTNDEWNHEFSTTSGFERNEEVRLKKRERVEKVIADLLESREEDSSNTSNLTGSLQNKVSDHSKKAKSAVSEQDISSGDSESMSTSLNEWTCRHDRHKFDLYYGKSDRGDLFRVRHIRTL